MEQETCPQTNKEILIVLTSTSWKILSDEIIVSIFIVFGEANNGKNWKKYFLNKSFLFKT